MARLYLRVEHRLPMSLRLGTTNIWLDVDGAQYYTHFITEVSLARRQERERRKGRREARRTDRLDWPDGELGTGLGKQSIQLHNELGF